MPRCSLGPDRPGTAKYLRRRRRAARDREAFVAESASSLNSLFMATARTGLVPVTPPDKEPSAAQRSILGRLGRKIVACGPPPASPPREALFELLRTRDVYEDTPRLIEPYDKQRLEVLTRQVSRRPIEQLVGPEGRWFLANRRSRIERSAAEVEAMMAAGTLQPIRPYWDQRLGSDRALRFDFFQELRRIGIGGLRRSIRARVAFFFVRKKNWMLRLVTDAR